MACLPELLLWSLIATTADEATPLKAETAG